MHTLLRIMILSIFWGLSHKALSQNMDVLEARLITAKGNDRISTLLELSFLSALSDAQQAERYATEALKLSRKSNWLEGQISAYHKFAVVARFQGYFDKAIAYSDSSTAILAKNPNKSLEAAIAGNLGVCYRSKGDYEKAITYFQRAIALHTELNQEADLGTVYNNLGVMYMYLEDYSQALSYYDKALDIQLRLGNKRELANIWNNYAIVYANQELLDSALTYFERSLHMEEAMGNLRGMSEGYNNIGAVYYYQGETDRAIVEFRKSYAIDSTLGDVKGQITTMNNMAEILTADSQSAQARLLLDRSLAMARQIDSKPDIAVALANQSSAYQQEGNFEKAFEFLSAYISVHDSVLGETQQSTIAEMETAFQTREKEQQLQIQELQLSENEIALAQRRNAIIGLTCAVMLILLLGYALYKLIQNRRAAELQAALVAEKEVQIKAVIDATESERRRIARELHDGIGQQITSIKLGMSNMLNRMTGSNAYAEKFEELMRATDQSAEEVRALAHQMMPRSLDEMGLVPALRDMVEKAFSISQIHHQFEAVNADKRYSPEIEIVLYRVAQELVNNVLKHANASRVSVAIHADTSELQLIVMDNGQGDVSAMRSNGIGMLNMRTRLAQIGGKISFENGQPRGIEALVVVHLVNRAA